MEFNIQGWNLKAGEYEQRFIDFDGIEKIDHVVVRLCEDGDISIQIQPYSDVAELGLSDLNEINLLIEEIKNQQILENFGQIWESIEWRYSSLQQITD